MNTTEMVQIALDLAQLQELPLDWRALIWVLPS